MGERASQIHLVIVTNHHVPGENAAAANHNSLTQRDPPRLLHTRVNERRDREPIVCRPSSHSLAGPYTTDGHDDERPSKPSSGFIQSHHRNLVQITTGSGDIVVNETGSSVAAILC